MATKFKPCSVPGCNGNAHYTAYGTRGMCVVHYNRWKRHGSVEHVKCPRGSAREYFDSIVLSHDADDCLIWPFARNNHGYAKLWVDGISCQVSRLACEAEHGPPPTPAHEAAHSCGKGHEGCVAKRHLSWKTPEENAADKVQHGTANRGERHMWSKLSESGVKQIREIASTASLSDIAAKFGMSRAAIRMIVDRKSWAWLE